MKSFYFLFLFLILSAGMVPAADLPLLKEEEIQAAIEVPGLSQNGVLNVTLGIETLSGIVSPIFKKGDAVPQGLKIRTGLSKRCSGCAGLTLYLIPEGKDEKPKEIGFYSVPGLIAKTAREPVAVFELLLPAAGDSITLKAWPVATAKIPPETGPKTEVWTVADHLIDCEGVVPMKCMLIKREGAKDDEAFYDLIKGLDYKEGYVYEVKVKISPVPAPAADASSYSYELVELIKKEPVITQAQTDLHDVWALKGGASAALRALAPGKWPVLEIHVKDAEYRGTAPCNEYSGKLEIHGEGIQFAAPVSTKKACPGLKAEADYFRLLQRADAYQREGLTLKLFSKGKEVLRFKKAD